MLSPQKFALCLGVLLAISGCGDDNPPSPGDNSDIGVDGGDIGPDADGGLPDADGGLTDGDACVPNCEGKECGDDGCGEPCGTCTEENYYCDYATSSCRCDGEAEGELCALAGAECGKGKVVDRCGAERPFNCGATCAGGDRCGEDNRCHCLPVSHATLCTRDNKNCGPYSALDNCGTPVSIEDCAIGAAACPSEKDCNDNVCTEPRAPTNDECAQASPLVLVGGAAERARLNLAMAGDNASGSCASAHPNMRDAVYELKLEQPSRLHVELSNEQGVEAKNALYILRDCELPQSELGCALSPDNTRPAKLDIAAIGPGTFYLWLDTTGNSSDARWLRNLKVEATPLDGEPPPNDQCGDGVDLAAEELHFTDGVATVEGDTTLAADDLHGCDTSVASGKDLFYRFEVTDEEAPVDLAVRVAPVDGSPIIPGVALLSSCDAQVPFVECAAARVISGQPATANLGYHALGAGTWILAVDTVGARPGSFMLTVTLSPGTLPPANDGCSNPERLTFAPGEGTKRLSGSTVGATSNWSRGICQPGSLIEGPDVVYALTVENPSALLVHVDFPDKTFMGVNEFMPVPFLLRKDLCETEEVFACGRIWGGNNPDRGVNNRAGTLNVPELEPGTWYLVIDAVSETAGRFLLDIDLIPKIVNDNCATAAPLDFSQSNQITIVSTTEWAEKDAAPMLLRDGGCSNNDMLSGKDLVWKFNIEAGQAKNLTVRGMHKVYGIAPWNSPTFFVRKECGVRESEVACLAGTKQEPGTSLAFTANRLTGGATGSTWYLWAEGAELFDGPFQAQLTLSDSTLALNDLCGDAELLVLKDGLYEVKGNTIQGKSDYTASCNVSANGGDLVYRLPITSPSSVTVSVSREDSSMVPLLFARAGCGPAAADLACALGTSREGAASLSIRNVSSDLFLFVASPFRSQEGAFKLTATVSEAGQPPPNDTCDGAFQAPLTLSARTLSVRSGSYETTDAAANYFGTCAPHQTGYGADLLFTVEVPVEGRLTARAERESATPNWQPAIYLRKAPCEAPDAASELSCGTGSSGVALTSAHVLPGLYYVVVDGMDTTPGRFHLDLWVTPQGPVADTCDARVPIAIDADTIGQVRVTGDTSPASDGTRSTILGTAGGRGNGPDVVYSFTLTAPAHLSAKLAFLDTEGEAILYLRRDCAGVRPGDELAASFAPLGGPALLAATLAPDIYYLWIDSTLPLRGAFDLVLETSAPVEQEPQQASCAALGTSPLLHDRGTITIQGSTNGGGNHASASCREAPGAESVYLITLPPGELRSLTAVAKRVGDKESFNPVLYLRTQCASGELENEASCVVGGAGRARLDLLMADAPAYYLFVDNSNSETDSFELTVTLADPIPDTCADAERAPRTFAPDGTLTLRGHFDGARPNSDDDLFCGASAANVSGDVIYKIRTPSFTGERSLVIDLAAENPTLFPTVFVRKRGCEQGEPDESQHWCSMANPGTRLYLNVPIDPDSTFWLRIHSSVEEDRATGDFAAHLALIDRLGNPPAGSCEAPLPVALPTAGGYAHVEGSTATGEMLGHTTCQPSNTGREQVYLLDLQGPATLEIVAKPKEGSRFVGSLELRTSCSSAAPMASCANPPGMAVTGTSTHLKVTTAEGGHHLLWVDGYRAGADGPFTLSLFVKYASTALPDTCAALSPLTLEQNGTTYIGGTLTGATDDYENSCSASGAPELLYTFTLGEARSLSAVLEGSLTLPLTTLSLRTVNCASALPSSELGCSSGTAPHLFFRSLPPAQYWLFAEGSAPGDAGLFDLALTLGDPMPNLPNDRCDGLVVELTPGPDRRASLEIAALEAAHNNLAGACGAMPGPDLVYKLVTPAGMMLRATATPASSTLAPSLYIRTECETSGAGEPCARNERPGTAATLRIERTLETTYYLIVDAVDPWATGGFVLDVSLYPPPAAAGNDRCAAPLPESAVLEFSGSHAHVVDIIDDATPGTSGTCAKMVGPDKVYRFTLGSPSSLEAVIHGVGFAPSLYLRKDCDDVEEASLLGCSEGNVTTRQATISAGNLVPGDYYLWVDSTERAPAGSFRLELTLGAPIAIPSNDRCPNAESIDLTGPAPVVITKTGDLTAATNDSVGARECSYMPSADVVYSFTIANGEPRRIVAELTMDSKATPPALYLRSSCTAGPNDGRYGCALAAPGGKARMVHARLERGTYFLWVDSTARLASGAYTLKVTAETPAVSAEPERASCAESAIPPLSFIGNVATETHSFTLGGREDTTTGSCHNARGPEFIYRLVLEEAAKVTINAKGTPTTGDAPLPVVYLRTSCASESLMDERGCIFDTRSTLSNPDLVLKSLVGTYYLFVDFVQPDAAGTFTLTVTKEAPVSPVVHNDTCATAQELKADVPYYGTTAGASGEYLFGRSYPGLSTCATVPTGQPGPAWLTQGRGPDVVFKYMAPNAAPFTIDYAARNNSNTHMWVLRGCESSFACETYVYRSGSSYQGSYEVSAPIPGQTYYIFLDVLNDVTNNYGPYTIEVRTR